MKKKSDEKKARLDRSRAFDVIFFLLRLFFVCTRRLAFGNGKISTTTMSFFINEINKTLHQKVEKT